MRKMVVILVALIVLVMMNAFIYQKESQLQDGAPVLLKIIPVDPRSLAQGDYVMLRYDISRNVPKSERKKDGSRTEPEDGRIIITQDTRGVAKFERLDDGAPPRTDELFLKYSYRAGEVTFGAEAFFYEEGKDMGRELARARYAEVRVSPPGDAILVCLRDEDYRVIGISPSAEQ